MPTTYTNGLRLALQATGENNNTWGTIINANTIEMLEDAVQGLATINLTGLTTYSLSTANGTTDEARMAILKFTGSPSATVTVTLPTVSKIFVVYNTTSRKLTFTTGAGATVDIAASTQGVIFCDGSAVYTAVIQDPDRWCGTSSGGSNTYAVTLSSISAYAAGLVLRFNAHQTNTGAATLNLNGLGAKSIVRPNGESLKEGDILSNGVFEVVYDGTSFELQTLSGSGSVSVGLGTAVAPSFTFAGDPNTGFYSPAANQIGAAVDGELVELITRNQITLSGDTGASAEYTINQPETGNTYSANLNLQKNGVTEFRIRTQDDNTTIMQHNGTSAVPRVKFNADGSTIFYDETGTNVTLTLGADQSVTFGGAVNYPSSVNRVVASGRFTTSGAVSGTANGLSFGSWSLLSGAGILSVTFSTAQADTNYTVLTDPPEYNASDGTTGSGWARMMVVGNKTTTGFSVYLTGQLSNNVFGGFTPVNSMGLVVVRGS